MEKEKTAIGEWGVKETNRFLGDKKMNEEYWDRKIAEDDSNCNEEDYKRNLLTPME